MTCCLNFRGFLWADGSLQRHSRFRVPHDVSLRHYSRVRQCNQTEPALHRYVLLLPQQVSSTLHPQCSAVQYSAVQCSTVQYSAVQCSAVQCSAVQYSTVQYSTVQCSIVQCSTVQCSAVQYSAVQCSTVQCSTVLE